MRGLDELLTEMLATQRAIIACLKHHIEPDELQQEIVRQRAKIDGEDVEFEEAVAEVESRQDLCDRLLRAYNHRDDVAFDRCIQEMGGYSDDVQS